MKTAQLLNARLRTLELFETVSSSTPSGSVGVELGPIGRCPHVPACTWFVFDSSGSVAGTQGNDPVARRFDEARFAVQAISRRCRCDRELVGVVHFDVPTSLDLAPISIRKVARIDRALAIPPDAAGQSLLRPGLDAVINGTAKLPDHEHRLVVASDFELFDSDLDGLYRNLREFDGVVHAVCLRSTPPDALFEDESIVITEVNYGAEPGIVARAVVDALANRSRP